MGLPASRDLWVYTELLIYEELGVLADSGVNTDFDELLDLEMR